MMLRHRSLVLASFVLGGVLVAGLIVACGSDASPSPVTGAATSDAATSDVAASTDAGLPSAVVTIAGTRGKIYLGQTARIDGAAIAPGVTVPSWQLIASPQDSALTTSAVRDAASSTPLVTPDRLGTYTLRLTGTRDGAAIDPILVTVDAVDAPTFWLEGQLKTRAFDKGTWEEDGASFRASTHVGGIFRGDDRALACFATVDGFGDGLALSTAVESFRRSAAQGDSWEGPPETPSRVVHPYIVTNPKDGSVTSSIVVATTDSSCTSGPSLLETRTTAYNNGDPSENVIMGTRFSPDGTRIAYVHTVSKKVQLSTIGFDGAAKRDLSPMQTRPETGGSIEPNAGPLFFTDYVKEYGGNNGPTWAHLYKPRWRDSTHIGWISHVPDQNFSLEQIGAWDLYVIEDVEGAKPELAMRCSSPVTSFDFTVDGDIVAASRVTRATGLFDVGPYNVVVYRANPTTKQCEVVRKLTNNTTVNIVVRDVAISPDRSRVAFISGSYAPGKNTLEGTLFTAPIDGSSPATAIPGTTSSFVVGGGPRWAAGGTALTWGKNSTTSAMLLDGSHEKMDTGGVVATSLVGGIPRAVSKGQDSPFYRAIEVDGDAGVEVELRLVSPMGQGCNVARGASHGGVLGLATGLVMAFGILRRRRAPAD